MHWSLLKWKIEGPWQKLVLDHFPFYVKKKKPTVNVEQKWINININKSCHDFICSNTSSLKNNLGKSFLSSKAYYKRNVIKKFKLLAKNFIWYVTNKQPVKKENID